MATHSRHETPRRGLAPRGAKSFRLRMDFLPAGCPIGLALFVLMLLLRVLFMAWQA